MTYKVTETKILVRYVIYYDSDTKFAFKVAGEPVGVSVRILVIRKEYMDNMCTTICMFY